MSSASGQTSFASAMRTVKYMWETSDQAIHYEIQPELDQPSMLAYIWRTYVWTGPLK